MRTGEVPAYRIGSVVSGKETMMGSPKQFVGIDVSNAWLDVAHRPSGELRRVENREEGWQQLVTELQSSVSAVLIVLEATGGYESGVVVALADAGLTPVVANPISTRRFAQSLGTRAKTDRIDAAMLAEYAERMRPTPRPMPEATARPLQDLLARRRQLTKLLVEEKNHLHGASGLVRPQVERLIAILNAQRDEIDKLLASTVASDPSWQARVEQWHTGPGFGVWTATLVAVSLKERGRCTSQEVAALVGVAPHPKESGQVRGQRRISAGRGPVRHALYEAMMTTIQREPTFQAHFEQLERRGKPHKQAMVACMRRLLGILTAMVREGLTWQQTKVGQGKFLTPAA
jgi:transposase